MIQTSLEYNLELAECWLNVCMQFKRHSLNYTLEADIALDYIANTIDRANGTNRLIRTFEEMEDL